MFRRKNKLIKFFSYERKKQLYGYGFIALWIIGTVFYLIRPLFQVIIFSVGKISFNDTGYSLALVGLDNYIKVLTTDAIFIKQLTAAIGNIIYEVPVIVFYSLTIAIGLNKKFAGRTFMRAVFFIPVIVASGVVISILNGDIMAQLVMSGQKSSSMFSTGGIADYLFSIGLPKDIVNFLVDTANNVFDLSWKSGIQILLFIAALQTIPSTLYEASKIEGATGWEIFWKITLPKVTPMIILAVVYTVIDSFTDYNNELMKTIQTQSRAMNIEISSVMSLVYFFCIMLLTGIIYFVVNRYVFYVNDN